MSKKKQREEELIQTHVINLNEIREAERHEKHQKTRRKPLIFSTLGILLIIMGFAYPSFKGYFSYTENVVASSRLNRNTLTCISNIDDNVNKVKTYTKSIYTFNNNELYKSESNVVVSLINSKDYNIINSLKDKYSAMYVSNDSIKYDINVNDNKLYINMNTNYNNVDYANYNDEINRVTQTYMFKGNEDMDTVKNTLENLGNLCN